MPATPSTFAELIDSAARAKGLNDYQLSAAIGLMPGNKVCSPKQVSRIRAGEQVNYSRDLVQRLIEVLDLDPEVAWELADKWPPGLTPDDLRKLGLFGAGRRRRSDREVEATSFASPALSHQAKSTTGTLMAMAAEAVCQTENGRIGQPSAA